MLKQITLALMASTLWIACKNDSFKKLKSGLEYRIVDDKSGEPKGNIGSYISIDVTTVIRDSVIFSTHQQGMPYEAMVNEPASAGDIMAVMPFLSKGDSAIAKIVVDSLVMGGQMPPFAKSGEMIEFRIKVREIQSKEDFEKSMKEKEAKQADADNKAIDEFVTKGALANVQKTASGLRYIITSPGTGANAVAGQTIKMKYTGRLLDGTAFDSNEDPKFGHVEPFSFTLGRRMVIPGWDEGIALLNKGAKAKLIVPSTLAYGAQSMPGNPNNEKGIPANSSLVFDVEVLDIQAEKQGTDLTKDPKAETYKTEEPKATK
jgi:FKBP-type peptidyl-prolyl cis-trans isomerase